MGGSITDHGARRDKILAILKTGSLIPILNSSMQVSVQQEVPRAFRLVRDVLSKGQIDLFFEEAAVNDETNNFSSQGLIRGMEGIVRHALKANSFIDIVLLYFVDPSKIEVYKRGQIPQVILNHEH